MASYDSVPGVTPEEWDYITDGLADIGFQVTNLFTGPFTDINGNKFYKYEGPSFEAFFDSYDDTTTDADDEVIEAAMDIIWGTMSYYNFIKSTQGTGPKT